MSVPPLDPFSNSNLSKSQRLAHDIANIETARLAWVAARDKRFAWRAEHNARIEAESYIRAVRPPSRLFPNWDLRGLIYAVEDLGLAVPGVWDGRKPRNVDERMFVECAKLAVLFLEKRATPLQRYTLPADPSVALPAAPDVDLVTRSQTRFLTYDQKVEYLRGMFLTYMDPTLHSEFMAYSTPQRMLDVLEEGYLYELVKNIPVMKKQFLDLVMKPGEDMKVYFMRGRELCQKLAEAGCVSTEHECMIAILGGVMDEKYYLPLSQLNAVGSLEFWSILDRFTSSTNWMGQFTHKSPSKHSSSGMFAPSAPSQVPPSLSGSRRGRGQGSSSSGRGRGSGSGQRSGTLCSFCNLPGHSVDTCWRKTPSLNPRFKRQAPSPTPASLQLPAALSQKQVASLMATIEGYVRDK